jgi:lysozyme family protein
MGFDEAIEKVLKLEGNFVDDPADHGGATNRGICQSTLAAWRKTGASRDDVRNLSEAEARAIYRAWYWNANRIDELPEKIRGSYFDVCVNSGGGQAARLIQMAINGLGGHIGVDGGIGPLTLAAIAACHPVALHREFQIQRRAFYHRIVARDPSQSSFLQGWLNRVGEWD